MAPADPATLAARLTRLAAPPTDADLLARYVAGRDGEAFAELVRRHGPAVLAACRRVTTHTQDAEDAFQATFLVLARKAARVRPGEPLGAWLYGVAVRAARKAAGRAGRRWEAAVAEVPDVPEQLAEPFDADAARAVAEEVERLSPWYRAAVVLCELEGRSRAAAARELGIAEGTLSSRLAAARKQLAARLQARGFGPAALGALVGVAVPPGLTAAAVASARGGPVPAAVAALAQGVVRTMSLRTLTLVSLAAVVGVSAAVAGGVAVGPPRPTIPAVRVAALATPAPVPQTAPAGPNRLVVWQRGEFVSLDPAGADEKPALARREVLLKIGGEGRAAVRNELYGVYNFAVSPDGKRIAAIVTKPEVGVKSSEWKQTLVIRGIGKGEPGDWEVGDAGDGTGSLVWSGDGAELAVSQGRPLRGDQTRPGPAPAFVLNLTTKTRTPLALPEGEILTDWSRDGRFFLTSQEGLWEKTGSGIRPVPRTGDPFWKICEGRFSPDGRRVLARADRAIAGVTRDEKAHRERLGLSPVRPPTELFVTDLAARTAAPLKGVPLNAEVMTYCWSPDGRRVAYVWREWQPRGPVRPAEDRTHLNVCEADGANPRTILSEVGEPGAIRLGGVDWR